MAAHIHLVPRLRKTGKDGETDVHHRRKEKNIFVYFNIHVLYIVKGKTEDSQRNNKNFHIIPSIVIIPT
jgi:hypothetical protein